MQITIEKLIYGGWGLAKTDNGVILIDGVLPQEIIEAKIIKKQKGVTFANIVKIIKPSPFRRQPPCPYYSECGGCDWQFINYSQQVEYKKGIFIDCLQRQGKLEQIPEIDIYPSPEWAYRQRAQFKIDTHNGKLGFFQKQTTSVIPIKQCPILVQNLNKLFEIDNLPNSISEIKAIASEHGITSAPVLDKISKSELILKIDKIKYQVKGNGFCQGNRFLMRAMGNWVRENCQGKVLIDLYGGLGFFALWAAQNFQKGILIESIKHQALQANENFALNNINNLKAYSITAERFFREFAKNYVNADYLIVDPPRQGLSDAVKNGILKIKPQNIIHISCNPSTQARDLNFFVHQGNYKPIKAALFDLYPQTHHVETIIKLTGNNNNQLNRSH